MDAIYPTGPAAVPANLTKPTAAYRRHAWIATGVLLFFVAIYLFLTGWFLLTAWRLLSGIAESDDFVFGVVSGLCAALLAVFMLKALFFVKHRAKIEDLEVTEQDQPRLFDFLHRLADEAHAPRPKRVFLSPSVNAAVFYDLSVLNLLLPSRKNLDIGLGLVNVLTVGEFKAVCAHEFGHFAQRTMAVGRWIYTAQQIAAHIIAKRDALDRLIAMLSRMDFRVAWIGWLLSLIIWSIRSLLESLFRLVILAHRALSREMEMQADLVSVSLTGSDALIHALHKLKGADDAWDRTIRFARREANEKRRLLDVFAVQSRILEQVRSMLGDSTYGRRPAVPASGAEAHRVFRAELAQPPKMWSTHPPNNEREENAKRTYLSVPIDERSAWEIFEDAQSLREKVTEKFLAVSEGEVKPIEESIAQLDRTFEAEHLKPIYRGIYLGRPAARGAENPQGLYEAPIGFTSADLDALYPARLTQDVEQLRSLQKERALLEAIERGALAPPSGVIQHRGRQIDRKDLAGAIRVVQCDIDACLQSLAEHDRRCRTVHLSIAGRLGNGWDSYLAGLLRVLHYAEHVEAHLRAGQKSLAQVCAAETATRRVSSDGIANLVAEGRDVHRRLSDIFQSAGDVVLDATLCSRLKVASWQEAIGTMELPPPDSGNIGDWLQVIDSWVGQASEALNQLSAAALDQLLETEAKLAAHLRDGTAPEAAPAPSSVPRIYATLPMGGELERPKAPTGWVRFQTAEGTWATVARTAAALAIVGGVLGAGWAVQKSDLFVYNGLERNVVVSVGNQQAPIAPHKFATFSLDPAREYALQTMTADGKKIEAFREPVDASRARYVYNVASASALIVWTAVYGTHETPEPKVLGAPRWLKAKADYLFEDPPKSVSTGYGETARRDVLSAADGGPSQVFGLLHDGNDLQKVAIAHVRWDSTSSPEILNWMSSYRRDGPFQAALQARLAENPDDVVSWRAMQDIAQGADHDKVCSQVEKRAKEAPGDSDFVYLAARCGLTEQARNEAFLLGSKATPDNTWLANAAGFTLMEQERWEDATAKFEVAMHNPALAANAALECARVRRMTAPNPGLVDYSGLAERSQVVDSVVKIRDGTDSNPALKVYGDLGNGRLDEALEASKGTPIESEMVRLAGSSTGATQAMIDRAANLSVEQGLDANTIWPAYGLALRINKNAEGYVSAIQKVVGERFPDVKQFVELAKARDFKKADMIARTFSLESRAHLYSLAIVMLDGQVPAEWTKTTLAALFVFERPFFR